MSAKTRVAPKYTAQDMEMLVADYFGIRQTILIPNVSWGLKGLDHEADLLVLRAFTSHAEEVEIKVSAADIIRDTQKNHGRGHVRSPMIRKLWFAVPLALAEHPEIPDYAGILAAVYDVNKRSSRIICLRAPVINKDARPLTASEIQQVLRLGVLRIWSLKQKLKQLQQKNKKNNG